MANFVLNNLIISDDKLWNNLASCSYIKKILNKYIETLKQRYKISLK